MRLPGRRFLRCNDFSHGVVKVQAEDLAKKSIVLPLKLRSGQRQYDSFTMSPRWAVTKKLPPPVSTKLSPRVSSRGGSGVPAHTVFVAAS